MPFVLAILFFLGMWIYSLIEKRQGQTRSAEIHRSNLKAGLFRPINSYMEKDFCHEYWENWLHGDRSMFPKKYLQCFIDERDILGSWICAMGAKKMDELGYNSVIYGNEDPFQSFNRKWSLVKYRYEKDVKSDLC